MASPYPEFHPDWKCSQCGPVLVEQLHGRQLGDPCPLQVFGTCKGTLVVIDHNQSREWTQKEIQDKFLAHISNMVDYWTDLPDAKFTGGVRTRMEGLAFSILSMLDGSNIDLPSFEVVPTPCEEDKEFAQETGGNWWPRPPKELEEAVTVHGPDALHELWHAFRKKKGSSSTNSPKSNLGRPDAFWKDGETGGK